MSDYKFETAKEALEDDGLVMDAMDESIGFGGMNMEKALFAIRSYRNVIFKAMGWGEFSNEVREEDCE